MTAPQVLSGSHVLVLRAVISGARSVKGVSFATGIPQSTAQGKLRDLTREGLTTHPDRTQGTTTALVHEVKLNTEQQ